MKALTKKVIEKINVIGIATLLWKMIGEKTDFPIKSNLTTEPPKDEFGKMLLHFNYDAESKAMTFRCGDRIANWWEYYTEKLGCTEDQLFDYLDGQQNLCIQNSSINIGEVLTERKVFGRGPYKLSGIPFNDAHKSYLKKLGLDKETLQSFGVIAISSYTFITKAKKLQRIRAYDNKPCFALLREQEAILWCPESKNPDYVYIRMGKQAEGLLGAVPIRDIGRNLIIALNIFDALMLKKLGQNVLLATNPARLIDADDYNMKYRQRFAKEILLVPGDSNIVAASEYIMKELGIYRLILGKYPLGIKSIVDVGRNPQKLIDSLNYDFKLAANVFDILPPESESNILTEVKTMNENRQEFDETFKMEESSTKIMSFEESKETKRLRKITYTTTDLINLPSNPQRFLVERILLFSGIHFLVGEPDSLKSMFLRELAITIAMGYHSFIGFYVNKRHKKVIYIATEDDVESIRYLYMKQMGYWDFIPCDIFFIVAGGLSLDEIIGEIESITGQHDIDLIIGDGYGDIFDGSDINSNTQVRNNLRRFDEISQKCDCPIIFIHHLTKSSSIYQPSQRSVLGAGSISQKARSVWQLTRRPDGLLYFMILKSNSGPSFLKREAMELSFDEQTYQFKPTGNFIPISSIHANKSDGDAEKSTVEEGKVLKHIFKGHHKLSHSQFCETFINHTLKSKATAKRFLKEAMESELVGKDNADGMYFLKGAKAALEKV